MTDKTKNLIIYVHIFIILFLSLVYFGYGVYSDLNEPEVNITPCENCCMQYIDIDRWGWQNVTMHITSNCDNMSNIYNLG
jgi:hypothetical protein